MQLSLTYYSLGVTISLCKFWFDNDTLIQVRYCHLLGIWNIFIVDILFSSFFDSAHDKIYVDIYLKIFWVYYIFICTSIRNVSCSFLLHIKYEKH